MENNRFKLSLIFIGGFLAPPAVWNFIMWYYGIVNTEEVFAMASVPLQGIYAIAYITFVIYYVNKKTKLIADYIDDNNSNDLKEVQESINFLPKFYIITAMIYCVIGPNTGMLMVDFLDKQDYILGLLLALPLILLFTLPFFSLVVYRLQKWTKDIPLSEERKFLTLKTKLAITMLVTVCGVLSLFAIFSIMSFKAGQTGVSLGQIIRKNIIMVVVSIGISLINFNLLAKQVVTPLKNLISKAKEDNFDGEVTITIRDEIGHLVSHFNQIISDMQNLISNVSQAVDELSAYSEELSASAQQGNATIENSDLEGISASIQEISATTEEATTFAEKSNMRTETGNQNIEETMASMKHINYEVQETVSIINDLDDNSAKIGEIINLINSIAEQTNLLALNAAIEAARAGEQGQGFAVVADEIRELAEETSDATENISNLINKTQDKTEQALKSIKMVEEQTEEGQVTVEETGEVFSDIEQSSQQTANRIKKTATAIQDLAQNSDRLISTSDEINTMSNEISTSAQDLAKMADDLQNMIDN
ncbi:MAG: methyl-accepting chemotaxis protein [Bacillota bacterium]